MLRLLSPLRRFSTSRIPHHPQPPFKQTPAPPRLPKKDQETFESLTKSSTGAFSTSHLQKQTDTEVLEELKHKDLLTGGEKPLFEGEKNPVTGEVGGPKTEPTKYGDWSYNGRVTDF